MARIEGRFVTWYPSVASQAVALTMDEPPLTGKPSRLNKSSMSPTPDSPSEPLWKLAVCRSPHFQREGSFPSSFSNAVTPSLNVFLKMSSRVSTTLLVNLSSHQELSAAT